MMRAITFQAPYKVQVSDVPTPTLQAPTDAIVKITSAGLCGSDMHPYRGAEEGLDVGCIMGHEFVGEIVELGIEVRGFAVGDRVGSGFTTCCGVCWYCKNGITCRCEKGQLYGWVSKGRGLHGAQAQYIRVPLASSTLLHIPPAVTDDEALLLGDILSTGFFCAEQGFSALPPHIPASVSTCVVVGCGPVGLMTILGAREYGAGKIFAIDSIPARLDLAKEFGAVPINMKENDVIDIIKTATDGRGADVVLEVVGHPSALELAYGILRPAGVLSSVGVHTAPSFPFTPSQGYDKNLTYRSGRCPSRAMMEKLLPIVEAKKYEFVKIVSHHVSLEEGVEMYRIFEERREGCTKVVFKPWD